MIACDVSPVAMFVCFNIQLIHLSPEGEGVKQMRPLLMREYKSKNNDSPLKYHVKKCFCLNLKDHSRNGGQVNADEG